MNFKRRGQMPLIVLYKEDQAIEVSTYKKV